jgi:multimeric flavodoxin WrbA
MLSIPSIENIGYNKDQGSEMKVKVVAINGSPRNKGNTSIALDIIFEEMQKESIETEKIHVGGKTIGPCKACLKCRQTKDGYCHGYNNSKNDILNKCLDKIYAAQGIIIGSPVYFGSVTPEIKSLIDRAGYASRSMDSNPLKRKVCSAIAVVRRQGAGTTLDQINNFFALSEAIVPYSTYWNMAMGREIGDILNDKEGINTLKNLGKNIAWLLMKLYNTD